jgi:hypothetical protein
VFAPGRTWPTKTSKSSRYTRSSEEPRSGREGDRQRDFAMPHSALFFHLQWRAFSGGWRKVSVSSTYKEESSGMQIQQTERAGSTPILSVSKKGSVRFSYLRTLDPSRPSRRRSATWRARGKDNRKDFDELTVAKGVRDALVRLAPTRSASGHDQLKGVFAHRPVAALPTTANVLMLPVYVCSAVLASNFVRELKNLTFPIRSKRNLPARLGLLQDTLGH